EAEQVLVAVAGAGDVDPLADDGGTGVAGAGVLEGPVELGPAVGPHLEQTLLGGMAIAVGAEPLRPVGGEGWRDEAQEQGRGDCFHPWISWGSRAVFSAACWRRP